MWMSVQSTSTNIHYDANDNVLVITAGTKRVRLWPPSQTHALQAEPVWSTSPNHSLCEQPPAAYTATLGQGDALYIPEGWWHQVDSEPGTMAINYWFRGLGHALTSGPEEMKVYYLRCLGHSMLQDARKARSASQQTPQEVWANLSGKRAKHTETGSAAAPADGGDAEYSAVRVGTALSRALSKGGCGEGEVDDLMGAMDVPTMREVLLALRYEELHALLHTVNPGTIELMTARWEEVGLLRPNMRPILP